MHILEFACTTVLFDDFFVVGLFSSLVQRFAHMQISPPLLEPRRETIVQKWYAILSHFSRMHRWYPFWSRDAKLKKSRLSSSAARLANLASPTCPLLVTYYVLHTYIRHFLPTQLAAPFILRQFSYRYDLQGEDDGGGDSWNGRHLPRQLMVGEHVTLIVFSSPMISSQSVLRNRRVNHAQ